MKIMMAVQHFQLKYTGGAEWRACWAASTLPIQPAICARCLSKEKRRFRWLSAGEPL